jgi:uncharacterized protein (DUF3820 family)
MIMPFGKHQGRELTDVPYEYLVWVRTNIPLKSKKLKTEIEWCILEIETEWQENEDMCAWYGMLEEH